MQGVRNLQAMRPGLLLSRVDRALVAWLLPKRRRIFDAVMAPVSHRRSRP
jgi:hypothetical protein